HLRCAPPEDMGAVCDTLIALGRIERCDRPLRYGRAATSRRFARMGKTRIERLVAWLKSVEEEEFAALDVMEQAARAGEPAAELRTRYEELCRRRTAIEERILVTPARRVGDMLAKLRLCYEPRELAAMARGDRSEATGVDGRDDVVGSVVRDLMALARAEKMTPARRAGRRDPVAA